MVVTNILAALLQVYNKYDYIYISVPNIIN